MSPETSLADTRDNLSWPGVRWGGLLAIWGAIGVIWCGLLPLVAQQPGVKMRLDELQEQGIDASAMYYTELPAMNGVLHVLQEFRDRHPRDLWVPIWGEGLPADSNAIDGSAVRN